MEKQDLHPWARPARYLTEFVGTFILVFVGTGAMVIDGVTEGTVTNVGIGITFGLIVMVVIVATGHLSGAHINPAVTLAFALTRHFRRGDIIPYWIAQLTGATAASAVVLGLFGNVNDLGATLPHGSAAQSFWLELFLTAILMFAIMSVATDSKIVREHAAIVIGATVGLEAIFAGPISGASMNPARSFGPALIGTMMDHHWIYWAGPILGAIVGAFLYKGLRIAQEGQNENGREDD